MKWIILTVSIIVFVVVGVFIDNVTNANGWMAFLIGILGGWFVGPYIEWLEEVLS